MNARRGDMPERLLDGDATAFERRVLENALERGPSAEVTRRMAQALGVGVATAAPAPPPARPASTAAPAAASAPNTLWPWISAVVVALTVTGIVIGTRARGGKVPQPSSAPAGRLEAPVTSPPAPAPSFPAARPEEGSPGVRDEARPSPAGSVATRATTGAGDLRGEIELVDGARAALTARSPYRALEIVRRYEGRYPSGTFTPEATAVKVEALVRLGRTGEARKLASRFVSEHRDALIADRIAALASVPRQ